MRGANYANMATFSKIFHSTSTHVGENQKHGYNIHKTLNPNFKINGPWVNVSDPRVGPM